MDLNGKKRKELQELCKKHNIPANLTNLEMVEKLSSVIKGQEEVKPARQTRSCLKESDVLNKNAKICSEEIKNNANVKKVRFSPDNDVFEVSRSRGMGKVNSFRMRGVEDTGESSVRVTRGSRGVSFGGHEALISSPVVVNKRGKRGVKEVGTDDKELGLVVDLDDNGGDGVSEVISGKFLRNRAVDSVLVSKKNVKKVVSQKRSEGSGVEVSESEATVVNGGIMQCARGLRRSTRKNESDGLNGAFANSEVVGKGKTGSRSQLAVDGSGVDRENKSLAEVNKGVHVSSRMTLRQRDGKSTRSKSTGEVFENKAPTAGGRNTRSGKALRQSSIEETEDSTRSNAEFTNIDLVGKRNVRSGKAYGVDNEMKTETEIVDACTVPKRSLRRRSRLRMDANSSGVVSEEVVLKLDDGFAEPEKVMRRSKRNRTEFVEFESLQKELGIAEMATRRSTRFRMTKDSVVTTECGTKIVPKEASEVLIEAGNSLQCTNQRINRRRTGIGNKVEGVTEMVVQTDDPALRKTRFSLRRKSVLPQIKKAKTEERLTENSGRDEIGEKDSSTKFKKLNKGSKIKRHVGRPRRKDSADDALVISHVGNGIDNSVGKIQTRKRGRVAIQEEASLQHISRRGKRKAEEETGVDEPLRRGRHVKGQDTGLRAEAEGEIEVAVQFDKPVQRQTKTGSRRKSVMPKIKNAVIDEPVPPNQSGKHVGQKGSESRGHARRSGRNASVDDSHATSAGSNGIDHAVEKIKPRRRGREAIQEENFVKTEHVLVVGEPSARKRNVKKPESSSKSPNLEVDASLPEIRAETPSLVEARDLVTMNEAETSAPPSTNLQTDKMLATKISASKHASITQEPSGRLTRSASKQASVAQEQSGRVTRSATKGKIDRLISGKVFQKKPERSTKSLLVVAEASLSEFTSVVEEPAIPDGQSLPEVSVCINDQGLSTSNILLGEAASSVLQDNSGEATVASLNLEESKVIGLINTSPSNYPQSQTDHIELASNICADEHGIVEKAATVDSLVTLPEAPQSTSNLVSSASDDVQDKIASATLPESSCEVNAEIPNLEASKGPDLMNNSPSDFLKLQPDHNELELDMGASTEKSATANAQLSLAEEVRGNSSDPVSSTTHIHKDNTASEIQHDCFLEANNETLNSVHLKPVEIFNPAVNANPEDITAVADGSSLVDEIAEVAESTVVPVSVTTDIENTSTMQRRRSTEANNEDPDLAHLGPEEKLDMNAGFRDTTSVADGSLPAYLVNLTGTEEKSEASKDVQPNSSIDDGSLAEQATLHEEQEQPIYGTGEIDELHRPIRQESNICEQSTGPIQIDGLVIDNGNASMEVEQASSVDFHDAVVSTFPIEEGNDARQSESSLEAAEPCNSISKSKEQEKEVSVPKVIRVTDEPSILDTVLSKPDVCESELSTVYSNKGTVLSKPDVCESEPSTMYSNKEVLQDSKQKGLESASVSCLKEQERYTSSYVDFSNSKEIGYQLLVRNVELESKSLSSGNRVPEGAAEDVNSCFRKEQNAIESADVCEGHLLKDGDVGFEIIKEVSILDSSCRERSNLKMSPAVKDGEDSDQTANMQHDVPVSLVIDYNLGGGKSTENEFGASSISPKELLSPEVDIESKHKVEICYDQQPIIQHDCVEAIPDRGADIYVGLMPKGEDYVYDNDVGAASLGVSEEAKKEINENSPKESGLQVIPEKENDKAEILPSLVTTPGSIISIDDQELEEVTRAKGSDDQCSVQVIFPQKTEEEIISAASDESRQESLLKTLFETPNTRTSYNEKQTSTDDVPNSVVAISLEKVPDQKIDGRLSQEKPLETVELNEIEDNEGSSLKSSLGEITREASSSIERTEFSTDAPFSEINETVCEVSDIQTSAELSKITKCGREIDAVEGRHNEQMIAPGSPWISEETMEAASESAMKTVDSQSVSARDLLEEGGRCNETSGIVVEDFLSSDASKPDDRSKSTDGHSFVETVPQLDACSGEIDCHLKEMVQEGIDERSFLVQGDVEFMKVKHVETPKRDIAANDNNQGFDLEDDAPGLPIEKIPSHEDATKENNLNSCSTHKSTEETNEALGSSDYFLNDSFEYGAADLFADPVMFSTELNSFMRDGEVQEEKSNVLSQKNIFILEKIENVGEKRQSLAVFPSEEQMYKQQEGERLGVKDVHKSDEKISEDTNVATTDEALFESQHNAITSSTKHDEDSINMMKDTTNAGVDDDKPFVGEKADIEARGASVSSEAKSRPIDQSTTTTCSDA